MGVKVLFHCNFNFQMVTLDDMFSGIQWHGILFTGYRKVISGQHF